MSYCGPRGRSRDLMLVPTFSQRWCRMDLDSFLVSLYDPWTTGGEQATPRPRADPVVPPFSPTRRSSPWRSSPSGARFSQREGRRCASPTRTCVPLPGLCTQSHSTAGCAPGARVARVAAGLRRDLTDPSAVYRLLDTPSYPVDREGEGISQETVLGQANFGGALPRPSGSTASRWPRGRSRWGGYRLGLAPASSAERPIGEALVARDRHEA